MWFTCVVCCSLLFIVGCCLLFIVCCFLLFIVGSSSSCSWIVQCNVVAVVFAIVDAAVVAVAAFVVECYGSCCFWVMSMLFLFRYSCLFVVVVYCC